MDASWKLLLAGFLTWWLPHMLVAPKATDLEYRRPIGKEKTDTRYVVAFGRENLDIFCLGAIISPQAIMTLASCFENVEIEDRLDYIEDYHERRKRKVGSRLRKTETQRKNGWWKSKRDDDDEDYDDEESPSQSNSTSTLDDEGQAIEKGLANEEGVADYYDEPNDVSPRPPEQFSLFRIDPIKRVFVRLEAEASNAMPHPDYRRLNKAYLWQHDLRIAFTSTLLDFGKETIRPIRLYIDGFGNYMKALNNAMMNAENCHVIGLVQYSDNGSYTPRDTDVELISHHVLLDYENCQNQFCSQITQNATGNCLNIGYHISKDKVNPLPYVVTGSPLVCNDRLLSLVNMKSRCDESKFSGEFPSPPTIRDLIMWLTTSQNITVMQEAKQNSTWPSIPFPEWEINTGPQQVPSGASIPALLLVTKFISL